MSALFQGFKQSLRVTLIVIACAVVVAVLAVSYFVHNKNVDDRKVALDSYAVQAVDLRVGECFEKVTYVDFDIFGSDSEEEVYRLDQRYDGDFYRCVKVVYTMYFTGSYTIDRDNPDVPAMPRHDAYDMGFRPFAKCFAGMNADERASLKAADCVIKAAGPIERESSIEREAEYAAQKKEEEARRAKEKLAFDKAFAAAKPTVHDAILAQSPKGDAQYRAASVLASCKYESDAVGGYFVALDSYIVHSQAAVGSDYNELFDNARQALCNVG